MICLPVPTLQHHEDKRQSVVFVEELKQPFLNSFYNLPPLCVYAWPQITFQISHHSRQVYLLSLGRLLEMGNHINRVALHFFFVVKDFFDQLVKINFFIGCAFHDAPPTNLILKNLTAL